MRWLGLIGVAVALSCWTPYSLAQTLPVRQKQLFDHAGLLSTPAARRVAGRLAEARSQGRDLVVVTVDSLEGEPAERYARRLVRRFGVGSEAAAGALLLVAERQRRIWIEPAASRGRRSVWSSFRSIGQGLIARAFRAGRYDAGIEQGVEALLAVLWQPLQVPAAFEPTPSMAAEATIARRLSGETSQPEFGRPELGKLFGPGLLVFMAAIAGPRGRTFDRRARTILAARRSARPGSRPAPRAEPNQIGATGPWVA